MRFFHYVRLSTLYLSCLCLTGCGFNWLPTSQSDSMTKQAENEVRLGLSYLQTGDNGRAKEKLLQAQQKAPRSATVNSSLGYFFTCIGEWEQAKAHHLKALALEPKSAAVHNNYGHFLGQRAQYETAATHFLIAAQDNQYINTANAYENAALCMLQVGKNQKALKYFNRALTQNRHLTQSWWSLAELYYQSRDYVQSKKCWDNYQQVVAQPSSIALWLGVQLAIHLNQQEEARQYATRLHTQYPDSTQCRDMLTTYPSLVHSKELLYD